MKKLYIIYLILSYFSLFGMEQISQPKSLLLLSRIAIRNQLIQDMKSGKQSAWYNESCLPEELKERLNNKSNIAWAAFADSVEKQELEKSGLQIIKTVCNWITTTNIAPSLLSLWNYVSKEYSTSAKFENESIDFSNIFYNIKISPDNSFVVTVPNWRTVKAIVWKSGSDQPIADLHHECVVREIAISSDSNFIVTLDRYIIQIWDAKTFTLIRTIANNKGKQNCLAISSDNKFVAVGLLNGDVIVYSMESGKPIYTLLGHNDMIASVAISTDNSFIVTASCDNTIRIWDCNSGDQIGQINYKNSFGDLEISNDNSFIAVRTPNCISIWDSKLIDCIAQWTTDKTFNYLTIKDDRFIVSETKAGACTWLLQQLNK